MSQTPIAPPQPTAARSALRELKCPQCGSSVKQFTPDAQTLVCPTCHGYIQEGMEGVEFAPGKKLPSARLPIKIGQTLTFDGLSYFVMGRVLYKGWEPDDMSDNWSWNEWLLGSKDGRLLWLSLDEHGLVLFNKLRVKTAFDPHNDSRIPVGDGQMARVVERYPAAIVGAEGELTWKAKRGDQVFMVEGENAGKKYSVQVTPSEIEIHEGSPLSKAAIAQALGADAAQAAAQPQEGVGKTIGFVCLVFAIVALIIAVVASRTGTSLINQTFTVIKTQETKIPVNFTAPGRPVIIRLALQGVMNENTVAEVEASIVAPNEVETIVTAQDFWHETGIDEGERWRETRYSGEDTFVPYLAGRHSLDLALDPASQIESATVKVEVIDKHMSPSFLLGYAAIVGIIGLFLFFSGRGQASIWLWIILGGVIIVGLLLASGVDLSFIGDILSEM